jgi:hypothetical protein
MARCACLRTPMSRSHWKMTSSATAPAILRWRYRCRVGAGQRGSRDSGHHLLAALTMFFRRDSTTEMLSDAIREVTRVLQRADGRITYGHLEKLLSLPVVSVSEANAYESKGEQSGIICRQFRGARRAAAIFRGPLKRHLPFPDWIARRCCPLQSFYWSGPTVRSNL